MQTVTQILKKCTLEDQFRLSSSTSTFYSKDGESTFKVSKRRIEKLIEFSHHKLYDEFMTLNQTELIMIESELSDNVNELSLITIKQIRKADKKPVKQISPFSSDYLVKIRNMHNNSDEVIIIYETMNVTLQQLTDILQDLLKVFQITAICKKVRASSVSLLEICSLSWTAAERSLILAQEAHSLSQCIQLQYNTSQSE